MIKLSELSRDQLIEVIDNGDYSDQDVIDLYDEFKDYILTLRAETTD